MNSNVFTLDSTASLTQSDTTEVLLESVEAEIEVTHPVLMREPTRSINRDNQKHSSGTNIRFETAPSTQWYWPRTQQINHSEQQTLLANKGYKIIKTLSDTLQGQLYKAQVIQKPLRSFARPHTLRSPYVAIKKTEKYLYNRQITIEDGASLCVSEHIIKEALILKHLSIDNSPIGDYVIKFVDFFESHSSYYLVMEYVESEMNLKEFVYTAQQYIENGTLSIHEYQRIVRYLLWQLFVTIVWCHRVQRCAHLDVCMENIMVRNVNFIESKDGVSIDTKISIKLCDFGASEIFASAKENVQFSCTKGGLSIYNECYLAPNVFNGYQYDARYADNWCLGIILFQCMTVGKQLYIPQTMYQYKSGYWSLHNNELESYLISHHLLRYFDSDSLSLLKGLLHVNQTMRLNGMNILRHPWFKTYFKRYAPQINQKFYRKCVKMDDRFPFYAM